MKTIVISDLHNRVDWVEKALDSDIIKPYDNVIFLGDYFDDFHATKKDTERTALWLKESLKHTNREHLIGTHDLFYMFPKNEFLMVSGNSKSKANVISKILSSEDWKKLKMYTVEQDFLLSHAGVHSFLLESFMKDGIVPETLQEIVGTIIKPATDNALVWASKGSSDAWIQPGWARHGNQIYGGIIWLDWIDEFEPIPNINQIVGHTEIHSPDTNFGHNSINFNIDTKNKHIGIIENKIFSVIEWGKGH